MGTAGALLCAFAIVSPAVCATTFRLMARRGFRSAVITDVLYAPMFGLAAGAALAATARFWGAVGALSQIFGHRCDAVRASHRSRHWRADGGCVSDWESARTSARHSRQPILRADRDSGLDSRARKHPVRLDFGGLGAWRAPRPSTGGGRGSGVCGHDCVYLTRRREEPQSIGTG